MKFKIILILLIASSIVCKRQLIETTTTFNLKEISATSRFSYKFDPINVFDDNHRTAWCEGKENDGGKNESVSILLDSPITFNQIKIINGYSKEEKTVNKNWQAKELSFDISDNGIKKNFHVPLQMQSFDGDNPIPSHYDLEETFTASTIRISIRDVYENLVDQGADTCISEIGFSYINGDNINHYKLNQSFIDTYAKDIIGNKKIESQLQKQLIGIWQIAAPALGSGWSETRTFYSNGKFIYRSSQMSSHRIRKKLGTWYLNGNKLFITYNEKTHRKGKVKEECKGSGCGYVGGKVITEKYYERESYLLFDCPGWDYNTPYAVCKKFSKMNWFRLRTNPDDYR